MLSEHGPAHFPWAVEQPEKPASADIVARRTSVPTARPPKKVATAAATGLEQLGLQS